MSALKLTKPLLDRIDQVFTRCRDTKVPKYVATFVSTTKVFWRTLNNSLSLVDLSGIWMITVSTGDDENLNGKVFTDFFCGIAMIKHPSLSICDCCEMLLEDLNVETNLSESLNSALFEKAVDKSAIHELFKCEAVLKKAYLTFAADTLDNVDGGITWEEVTKLSVTMEVGNAFLRRLLSRASITFALFIQCR